MADVGSPVEGRGGGTPLVHRLVARHALGADIGPMLKEQGRLRHAIFSISKPSARLIMKGAQPARRLLAEGLNKRRRIAVLGKRCGLTCEERGHRPVASGPE